MNKMEFLEKAKDEYLLNAMNNFNFAIKSTEQNIMESDVSLVYVTNPEGCKNVFSAQDLVCYVIEKDGIKDFDDNILEQLRDADVMFVDRVSKQNLIDTILDMAKKLDFSPRLETLEVINLWAEEDNDEEATVTPLQSAYHLNLKEVYFEHVKEGLK